MEINIALHVSIVKLTQEHEFDIIIIRKLNLRGPRAKIYT